MWAGQFRRSGKSIGETWETILPALQDLLNDTGYWIENTTYAQTKLWRGSTTV